MIFPVLIIKEREAPIYFFKENNFGLVSKGGEKFYKYGTAYDSGGDIFSIMGIESIKKAPFLKSIKYFQQMYQVQVNCKKQNSMSLPEFKQVIIDHISSHRKYWLSKDNFEDLKDSIEEKNDFSEVILFLK